MKRAMAMAFAGGHTTLRPLSCALDSDPDPFGGPEVLESSEVQCQTGDHFIHSSSVKFVEFNL